jgi:hypothetical protein
MRELQTTTISTVTIQPDSEAALFDALAKLGIETVTVTFSAGWDYVNIDAVTVHPEVKDWDDRDEYGDGLYEAVTEFAHNRAETLGSGCDRYRRYDEGEYYQGTDDDGNTDDNMVILDIPKRTISLDAHAKVRVVEYRTDHKVKTWQLDADYDEYEEAED